MSILGALATLIGFGAATTASEIKHSVKAAETNANIRASQRYRGTDWERECQIKNFIDANWYYGDKSMYPEHIRPFLEYNASALWAYMDGLVNEELMKEGLQPYLCETFDVRTYNPFGKYNKKCKRDEIEFFTAQKAIAERGYALWKCRTCGAEFKLDKRKIKYPSPGHPAYLDYEGKNQTTIIYKCPNPACGTFLYREGIDYRLC